VSLNQPEKMKIPKLLAAAAAALISLCATAAVAGPPYQTDDPEPTELGHWEIYSFATADGDRGEIDGAAGFDLNYGAAKGLQLTATLPVAFNRGSDTGWIGGNGDIELGAKYRFLDDNKSGWQAAVFPRVILPTASHGLGGSRARFLLPIWVQKDWGNTSAFGGGGYEINPGTGNKDFWQAGIALTHDFNDTLSLGTEFTWQSADARGGNSTTGVNLGLIQEISGPFSLLLAGGPSFSGGQTSYHSYAALSLNF
jgi:hypothetical protein